MMVLNAVDGSSGLQGTEVDGRMDGWMDDVMLWPPVTKE